MKKNSKSTKVYLVSLASLLVITAYPLYMGFIMISAYLRDGGITATDYPKYVIPYTPISFSLLVCITFLPLILKYLRKYALPFLSIFALILFLSSEMIFEKITVFSGTTKIEYSESNEDSMFYYFRAVVINKNKEKEIRIITLDKTETDQNVETWQFLMCATPSDNFDELSQISLAKDRITDGEVIDIQKISKEQATSEQITEEPFTKESLFSNALITEYSPIFKMHFYMISIVIVLSVLGTTYGFYRISYDSSYNKKKPLIVQLIAVTTFVGLCVFACFTAFYRTGEIIISPLSAFLMIVFFLIFGITAGVYTGTWFYNQRKLFSIVIPVIISMIMTVAMYVGEMVMMDWNLYRYGRGILFDPFTNCPLSLVDFAVIVASGLLTFLILQAIKKQKSIT